MFWKMGKRIEYKYATENHMSGDTQLGLELKISGWVYGNKVRGEEMRIEPWGTLRMEKLAKERKRTRTIVLMKTSAIHWLFPSNSPCL